MKKDKLILIIFMIVILASGGLIYIFQEADSIHSEQPELANEMSQQSAMLLNQIAAYKERLKSEPENFALLVNIGNSYYDLNNPKESIKYYEMALDLEPNSPEVMVDCGAMYRNIGDFDRAMELFRKASELAPGLPQASFNLGAVLFVEKHDPDAAVKAWQDFLKNNPDINPEIKDFFEEKIRQAKAAH